MISERTPATVGTSAPRPRPSGLRGPCPPLSLTASPVRCPAPQVAGRPRRATALGPRSRGLRARARPARRCRLPLALPARPLGRCPACVRAVRQRRAALRRARGRVWRGRGDARAALHSKRAAGLCTRGQLHCKRPHAAAARPAGLGRGGAPRRRPPQHAPLLGRRCLPGAILPTHRLAFVRKTFTCVLPTRRLAWALPRPTPRDPSVPRRCARGLPSSAPSRDRRRVCAAPRRDARAGRTARFSRRATRTGCSRGSSSGSQAPRPPCGVPAPRRCSVLVGRAGALTGGAAVAGDCNGRGSGDSQFPMDHRRGPAAPPAPPPSAQSGITLQTCSCCPCTKVAVSPALGR